jgi:hypothetical protein
LKARPGSRKRWNREDIVYWPKSQEAISADIAFVSAGKRCDFCRLPRAMASVHTI